jgi:hypothetical protein
MPISIPDLSSTDPVGGGFEPVPDGWYTVRVDGASETTARTGTPGIALTLRIEEPVEHRDRLLWNTIWVTANSLGFVRQKLEAMGYKIPAGPFELHPNALVGRRVRVRTEQQPYVGSQGEAKTRVSVETYAPVPGDSFPSTPPAEDWREIVPPEHGGTAKPDDDIPF